MKTQKIEYRYGSVNMVGYLAWDETASGSRPGIVIFPEAFGLSDHARQRAERLANLGYIALAADMHGDGRIFDDMASLVPAIQTLYGDRSELRGRAQAALTTLFSQTDVDKNRTAAIGFCFGGVCCFELARSGAPLAAITTFHAGLIPEIEGDAGRVAAKVLICNGADDGVVNREALDAVTTELSRDQVDWQLIHYGGAVHSFTDPDADGRKLPGFAFCERTEQRSWALMQQLFAEAFIPKQ